MTTDDTPFPGTGYLQIGVPGVPYSAIRVPIINDLERDNLWIEHAMLIAELAAKAYKAAFPPKDLPQGTVYERNDPDNAWAPPPQQPRPQAPQRPPQGQQRPAGGGLDPSLVVRGECPQHPGVQVLPSKLMYQQIEMGEDGRERYAKYFCSGKDNQTGSNHQVWAREIIQG